MQMCKSKVLKLREYICQKCGVKFLKKGQGIPRYCIDCRGEKFSNKDET